MKKLSPKLKAGRSGEKLACDYLVEKGYKILETNYRSRFGEIDIIACDDDIFVFVEVKTKTTSKFGAPEEMVNKKKKQKLIRLAQSYLQEKELSDYPFRIDVVSVMLEGETKITHFKNAIEGN